MTDQPKIARDVNFSAVPHRISRYRSIELRVGPSKNSRIKKSSSPLLSSGRADRTTTRSSRYDSQLKIRLLVLPNQFDHFPNDGALYIAIRSGSDFDDFASGIADIRSPGTKQKLRVTWPHPRNLEYSACAGLLEVAFDISHSELFFRRLAFDSFWLRGLIFKNSSCTCGAPWLLSCSPPDLLELPLGGGVSICRGFFL